MPNDSALRMALQRLLAHGDAIQDKKMMAMAAAKKGGGEMAGCPMCAEMPDGEMCEECKAKQAAEAGSESELADALEQGEE